jgi:hypothetical protein
MNFKEAFIIMMKGETLILEDTEYRLGSIYSPSIQSRPVNQKDLDWEERIKGYILFSLASDLWGIENEGA